MISHSIIVPINQSNTHMQGLLEFSNLLAPKEQMELNLTLSKQDLDHVVEKMAVDISWLNEDEINEITKNIKPDHIKWITEENKKINSLQIIGLDNIKQVFEHLQEKEIQHAKVKVTDEGERDELLLEFESVIEERKKLFAGISNTQEAIKKFFQSLVYYPDLPDTARKAECRIIAYPLSQDAKLTIMGFFTDIQKLAPSDCRVTPTTESRSRIEKAIKIKGYHAIEKIFAYLIKRELINWVNKEYFLARIKPAQDIGQQLNQYLVQPPATNDEAAKAARRLAASLHNYSTNYLSNHTEKMHLFMEIKKQFSRRDYQKDNYIKNRIEYLKEEIVREYNRHQKFADQVNHWKDALCYSHARNHFGSHSPLSNPCQFGSALSRNALRGDQQTLNAYFMARTAESGIIAVSGALGGHSGDAAQDKNTRYIAYHTAKHAVRILSSDHFDLPNHATLTSSLKWMKNMLIREVQELKIKRKDCSSSLSLACGRLYLDPADGSCFFMGLNIGKTTVVVYAPDTRCFITVAKAQTRVVEGNTVLKEMRPVCLPDYLSQDDIDTFIVALPKNAMVLCLTEGAYKALPYKTTYKPILGTSDFYEEIEIDFTSDELKKASLEDLLAILEKKLACPSDAKLIMDSWRKEQTLHAKKPLTDKKIRELGLNMAESEMKEDVKINDDITQQKENMDVDEALIEFPRVHDITLCYLSADGLRNSWVDDVPSLEQRSEWLKLATCTPVSTTLHQGRFPSLSRFKNWLFAYSETTPPKENPRPNVYKSFGNN